jgi:signal transduction histidine kinase/ligand-binding sensor domain-containing protein
MSNGLRDRRRQIRQYIHAEIGAAEPQENNANPAVRRPSGVKRHLGAIKSEPARVPVTVMCLFVALLISHGALAQAPDRPQAENGYVSRNFTVEDGLLSNQVETMLQTRDGFLWVGTPEGLFRFDGRHFTHIKFLPEDSPILVSALAQAPDGALWVGTRGGLARIAGGGSGDVGRIVSTVYHTGSGDADWVQCVHFSRNGDLWVGTLTGFYRFAHGQFLTIIPKLWTSRIEEASNGHLLVITSQGFVEWDGKQMIRHPDLPGRLGVAAHGIFHVLEDHAGTIWYATTAGVARQRGGAIERLKPYGEGENNPNVVYRLEEDSEGRVWFVQSGNLYQAGDAGRQLVATNLNAKYLAADSDGDVWAGTWAWGLFRLKARAVKMFTVADGLPPGLPRAVLASSDGNLWVANTCGGLSRFDGSRFQTYTDKHGLPNSCLFSLAEDRNHDILIGGFGGEVSRFRDGHFMLVAAPDRLTNRVVTAFVPARDGALWIAYSDGLDRIADGQVRRFTTADGLSSNQLLSAYEDRQGVLWVETAKGIDRFVNDHFTTVLHADSPTSGAGRFGFWEDPSGKLFAFGPGNATFHIRHDGVIPLSGAPKITGMAESPENLWFCGDGINRATPESLQKWEQEGDAPPDFTRFNRADGMSTTQCSDGFRNMAVTKDGRLWAATAQGIAMLEFARLRRTDRKPAIFMEKIVIGKTVEPPGPELVLPPGTHHVELHFDTIELASPEAVRLQYRLDDVDREWLDADSTVTAVYSGIPVGTHRFHVRACNRDGVWDQTGMLYDVTQKPYFYETMLFRIAAAIMFAGLTLLLYQFRLRQIAHEFDVRLKERLEERTRIARELHDTLLQSLHGLLFRFQAARNLFARRPQEAMEALDGAIARTEEAIAESHDAIKDLRPEPVAQSDLGGLLRATGKELQSTANGNAVPPAFEVIVEGELRGLSPLLQGEVYRIARELLINAFRHACARRVEAEVHYAGSHLRVRIRDDGKGIAPEVLKHGGPEGHWGLRGVKERAERIGAKLDFWTEAGAGTEVQLTVPAAAAHRPSDVRRRFSFFHR